MWNYNPDNDDTLGDDWNGENFSWFSKKRALMPSLLDFEQTAGTLDVGARIVRSVVRPYPAKTAGIPLKFNYEVNTGDFSFEWVIPGAKTDAHPANGRPSVYRPPTTEHPPLTSNVTEIFVPWFIVNGSKIVVEGLGTEDEYQYIETRQTLYITAGDSTPGRVYKISVSLSPRLRPVFPLNDLWSDFGGHMAGAGVVVLAILAYILTIFL